MTTPIYPFVGLVGTGAMGRGIAQIAAQGGCQVLLFDAQSGAADTARGTDGACFTLALPPQEAAASPPGAGTEHAEA